MLSLEVQHLYTTYNICFLWLFISQELDNLVVEKKSIEMKTEILMEQLEASKRLIEAVQQESCCLEKHVKELERKLHTSHGETRAAEEKLQIFLGKVAGLLQEKSKSVTLSTEQDILHEVENLCKKVGNEGRDF